MDRISIKDITLYAYHGILPEEKTRGQEFKISVEATMDFSRISPTDNIDDTVDYSWIVEKVKDMVQGKRFNLLETLAENLALEILENKKIRKVRVTVTKPHPPLPAITGGVEVSTVRQNY